MFYGQSEQDKYILNVLKFKTNGYFLEIGSNHPININNTYILESQYNWKGIMVEYENTFLSLYKIMRPNSIHLIEDATQINYKNIFEYNNVPFVIDYLQIDLEVSNGSTIKTLQKLDEEIFDKYAFATITFEHDIYCSNFANTREKSREIFKNKGYYCVFQDISNGGNPYEDWYVHPSFVDMNYIKYLQDKNIMNYETIIINNEKINSINYKSISY